MCNKTQRERSGGFVLLLSVIITSVLLTIALGALSILQKSLLLGSVGEESQTAFYSADTGVECVLLWDLKHPGFVMSVFATSSASSPPGAGQGVTCVGQDIMDPVQTNYTIIQQDASSATTEFDMDLLDGSCVFIRIEKTNSGIKTVVEARGRNNCNPSYPRRLERAIRAFY